MGHMTSNPTPTPRRPIDWPAWRFLAVVMAVILGLALLIGWPAAAILVTL